MNREQVLEDISQAIFREWKNSREVGAPDTDLGVSRLAMISPWREAVLSKIRENVRIFDGSPEWRKIYRMLIELPSTGTL